MQRVFAFVVAIGLTSGLVGAFAYDQLGGDAGAAPPPPQPQPVREQNLDGSGFIRVHEQGTANVAGTVNVGNLPTDGQGNVRVATQGRTRITVIAENVTVTPNNFAFETPYLDVTDCRSLAVFTRASWADNIQHEIGVGMRQSLDGVLDQGARGAFGKTLGQDGQMSVVFTDGSPMLPPTIAVVLSYAGNVQGTLHNAWLYCTQ